MKKFLVYQLLILNEKKGMMNIDTVIRKVNADNSEEAINKFKLEVDKMPAESRSNIEYNELDLITEIK